MFSISSREKYGFTLEFWLEITLRSHHNLVCLQRNTDTN